MRKTLMVMVAAVMASTGFAAPAQATVTDVNMPFGMAYGNSTTSGTIRFKDGYSAPTYGTVHAASGTRYVCAIGVNGNEQDGYCSNNAVAGGPDEALNAPLYIPFVGGVQRVEITMWDGLGKALAKASCTRGGCTRVF